MLPSWWPRQWIAIFFGIALAAVAMLLTLDRAPPTGFACLASEPSVALCVRAWLQPLAGASSFVVAAIAASFAFRQFRIARQTQRLSILSERLKNLSAAYNITLPICQNFTLLYMEINMLCGTIIPRKMDVNPYLEICNKLIEKIRSDRERLQPILSNITVDFDLSGILYDFNQACDLEEEENLFKVVLAIELNVKNRLVEYSKGYLETGKARMADARLKLSLLSTQLMAQAEEIRGERFSILSG